MVVGHPLEIVYSDARVVLRDSYENELAVEYHSLKLKYNDNTARSDDYVSVAYYDDATSHCSVL